MYYNNNDYRSYLEGDYLCHYGVLGMKWGVRRYQNEDGTLTDKGKNRLNKAYSKYRDTYNSVKNAADKYHGTRTDSSANKYLKADERNRKARNKLDKAISKVSGNNYEKESELRNKYSKELSRKTAGDYTLADLRDLAYEHSSKLNKHGKSYLKDHDRDIAIKAYNKRKDTEFAKDVANLIAIPVSSIASIGGTAAGLISLPSKYTTAIEALGLTGIYGGPLAAAIGMDARNKNRNKNNVRNASSGTVGSYSVKNPSHNRR